MEAQEAGANRLPDERQLDRRQIGAETVETMGLEEDNEVGISVRTRARHGAVTELR